MDIERVDLLYDLLGALFRSSEELSRFLVIEGVDIDPQRNLNLRSQKQSKSADVYDVAQALVAGDLAGEAFFEALERRFPERAADIRGVADQFRYPSPYPGTATATGDDPSPYADFAARLSASLSALAPSDDTELSLQEDHWPWTGAASVLGSFDPLDLKPLIATSSDTSALAALRDVVTTSHDGKWVLRDDIRTACLARLFDPPTADPATVDPPTVDPATVDPPTVDTALRANHLLADRRRDLISTLLHGRPPTLALMQRDELLDLDAVLGWLTPFVASLPVTRADVHAAADRRLLIDPLRSLVGTHFRGRAEELEVLDEHLGGTTDIQLLLLRGAGGSGKSTLLGHVILELEQRIQDDPVAFAYIDFDKTRHDPRDSSALLRQLAQQLRLLYATSAEAEGFAAFEDAYAGTDVHRAAELLDIDLDAGPDRLLDTLCERLLQLRSDERTPPLLLFLDTFEEVTAEGPGAVRDVGRLMADLWKRLPGMRAVVTGRTVPTEFPARSIFRELTDLDPVAADAVLQHLGVQESSLRQLIIDNFGGNPLTLRLAAEALHRTGGADEAFRDVVPQSRALVDTALEQVQGMLYSRILGHLKDPEVASIAHPGLAVRVVTVDVLRDVLAEPCGIDPSRVEEVFGKLRIEMTLFDLEGDGSLRHRQDVRRIMLRAMRDDPKRGPEIAEIHRRAIAYYERLPGPMARTEELYHRLMSDEDPRSLDRLWEVSMAMTLAPALEEPLSGRAHRWLERRVVTGPPEPGADEWEQEDWEANAYVRAASWLASNDPSQAVDVLSERSARLTPSRLYALEVAARLQLGQVEAAVDAMDEGMRRSQGDSDRRVALDLAEQAVAVRTVQGDGAGLAVAALNCASVADLAGEPARGVRALAGTVTELRRLDDDQHVHGVQSELVRRFEQMTREQMLDDPDLVRHVLHAVGADDAGVLTHAVVAMGDQTDEQDGVFLRDTFAVTRLLQGTTTEAEPALSRLAEEVGLSGSGWKTEQLASLLVRTGRTGRALTLGLDFAADKRATQALVVNELVQPTGDVWGKLT